LRGISPPSVQAKQTHCKRGHPLEGENLRLRPDGRECRTCSRASKHRYKLARSLARKSRDQTVI
jgi:hypothetical protein